MGKNLLPFNISTKTAIPNIIFWKASKKFKNILVKIKLFFLQYLHVRLIVNKKTKLSLNYYTPKCDDNSIWKCTSHINSFVSWS